MQNPITAIFLRDQKTEINIIPRIKKTSKTGKEIFKKEPVDIPTMKEMQNQKNTLETVIISFYHINLAPSCTGRHPAQILQFFMFMEFFGLYDFFY